jgi:DNA-binding transcriptional LysR family regulator
MDRLEAMAMLVKVVDEGSLSSAARALGVPLSTLSRRISDLEALLGARLLIRTTRKLTMTDSGVTYVAAARRLLEQVEEVEREAAGEFVTPKGELVVSAPLMFGRLHVLPVVADFLEQFPAINIRLLLADRNAQLIDDNVDMAIRIGNLPDSSYIATPIGSMRTVICARPDLIAKYGVPSLPDDLHRLPCVTVDAPAPSPGWQFQSMDSSAVWNLPIISRLSVSTAEVAIAAAIRGVGVTRVLHYQVYEAIASGALQVLLEAFEPPSTPIHVLHASRGHLPLKMRRFLDFAAPRLRAGLK